VTCSNTADDYATNAHGNVPRRQRARRRRWRSRAPTATITDMIAAAMTLWTMFSVWLIAHCANLPPRIGRIALVILCLELWLLLIWSYGSEGCDARTCAPLAQAAGIAARTDVPILAAVYLIGAVLWLTRVVRARAR
jgi:hypothetical protein